MVRRFSVVLLLLIISLSQIWSSEQDRYEAVLYARALEAPKPPQLVFGHLVFSYQEPSNNQPRYVAAAFQHENYRELHLFSRTDTGLYALIYEVPPGIEEVTYRLIVDGVWTTDPANPNTVEVAGTELSALRVDPSLLPGFDQGGPIVEDDTVRFVLRRRDVERRFLTTVDSAHVRFDKPFEDLDIRLVGSFNDYDPYVHFLDLSDGSYTIELPLPPGDYGYYYLIEGERVLDPANSDFLYGERRSRFSRITVDF